MQTYYFEYGRIQISLYFKYWMLACDLPYLFHTKSSPFYLSTVNPNLSDIRVLFPSPDHDISCVYLKCITFKLKLWFAAFAPHYYSTHQLAPCTYQTALQPAYCFQSCNCNSCSAIATLLTNYLALEKEEQWKFITPWLVGVSRRLKWQNASIFNEEYIIQCMI